MAAPKKEKKLRTLPAEYQGIVYQSNRLTNAKVDYSMIQERIFVALICKLRQEIMAVKDGLTIQQLDLFSSDNIIVKIPLMAIAKPSYYNKVRQQVREMASIQVEIPHVIRGKSGVIIEGLLSAWVPDDRERSGELVIRIDRKVAEILVNIEHRPDGVPMHYTSFLAQPALLAKNKYTPRIYKYICSYKKEGSCRMKLDVLREMLQLGDKYTEYKEFRRRILLPVQKEVKKIGDYWFNFTPEKVGKQVVALNFKIYKGDSSLHYVNLWKKIQTFLPMSFFRLTKHHIKELDYLYAEHFERMPEIHDAIYRINEYLFDGNNRHREKRDIPAYFLSCMFKEFPKANQPPQTP